MLAIDILLVLVGLVLLAFGGEALVRGASSIATRAGVSSLVIGLVVVSAATSAPELAVTIGAVAGGESELAVGNVIGSNIANILLILGFSAVLSPLLIGRQVIRFDIPIMLGMSVMLLALSLDGQIGALDGGLLLIALIVHAVLSVRVGRKDVAAGLPAISETSSTPLAMWQGIILVVLGVALLVFGAEALVTGAVNIALELGVSGLVVGLTIVAIGTSLPELATSIIALRRNERDIAVGNLVGSNIFNLGMVLGLPAIIFPDGISVPTAAVALDIPLMVATAVALLPIAFTGFVIARWEGLLFFGLYVTYVLYVVLQATEHDAVTGVSTVMLWFVLPLIAITLVAVTAYEIGLHRGKKTGGDHPPDG